MILIVLVLAFFKIKSPMLNTNGSDQKRVEKHKIIFSNQRSSI